MRDNQIDPVKLINKLQARRKEEANDGNPELASLLADAVLEIVDLHTMVDTQDAFADRVAKRVMQELRGELP